MEDALMGAGHIFDQYHSGIIMKVQRAGGGKERYSIEMGGVHGMGGSIFPKIKGDTLDWSQALAVTVLKKFENKDEQPMHELKVATLKGNALNQLMQKIVDYVTTNKRAQMYNMFGIWEDFNANAATRRNNVDSICDGFSEQVIWLLGEVGATFVKDRVIIRRNYAVIKGQ